MTREAVALIDGAQAVNFERFRVIQTLPMAEPITGEPKPLQSPADIIIRTPKDPKRVLPTGMGPSEERRADQFEKQREEMYRAKIAETAHFMPHAEMSESFWEAEYSGGARDRVQRGEYLIRDALLQRNFQGSAVMNPDWDVGGDAHKMVMFTLRPKKSKDIVIILNPGEADAGAANFRTRNVAVKLPDALPHDMKVGSETDFLHSQTNISFESEKGSIEFKASVVKKLQADAAAKGKPTQVKVVHLSSSLSETGVKDLLDLAIGDASPTSSVLEKLRRMLHALGSHH
ncbi:MAG TPA: hypothetical protein VLF68_03710 [Candidatus Saccharimonadales bacterium]|nr:hypothetical protein [Candidatus Saccharimonadales bacterium]